MNYGRLGLLGMLMTGVLVVGCGDDASLSDSELVAPDNSQDGSNKGAAAGKGSGGGAGSGSVTSPPSQGFGGSGQGTAGSGFNSAAGASQGEAAGTSAGGTSAAGGSGGSGQAGSDSAAGAGGEAGAGGDAGAGGANACGGIDLSKPTTLYLSADDSNSMASAALARKMINSGQVPPASLVRPYEFLNYYNVAYEAPTQGQINLVPQMRPGKNDGEYDMQIGVQSAKPEGARRPMNLTLVLDNSGSMQGDPIALQKAAVKALATQLRSGDIISVTTWNTKSSISLSGHAVQGPNDPELLSVINSMVAGGGTDLHAGLVNGYTLAKKHYAEDRTNRVIVISDGIANVGITDEQMIGQEADIENKEGIYLVGIGVGDGVNDTLLNVVTDAGNGAYLYIDSEEEAQRMLANRFDEVVEIAARNVQVSMTMPAYFSIVKFSGEQYSTDPTKVKPQHLAPGDAMVISQTVRACSPTLVQASDPIDFRATWTEPGSWLPRSVEVKSTVGAIQEQSAEQLRRGQAIVAYADALKKGQDCAKRAQLVESALAAADIADPQKNDAALVEIREMVQKFGDLCP